ncbi:hypothetical protein L210DRAFT_948038 [Boletus edulis BED1]|uniref:Uncharacterized protein n=1 Tax=Boletus edulis BED1 TaxID=1328754 RepID=A0AAD4BHL6_BOLED|nr:hypothetical protein L210DRAFT_948038 [Boletus edulis BED1]
MNGTSIPMPFLRLALDFEVIHPATQMFLSLPTLSSRAIYLSDMASSGRATWAVDGFDEATRSGSHGPSL